MKRYARTLKQLRNDAKLLEARLGTCHISEFKTVLAEFSKVNQEIGAREAALEEVKELRKAAVHVNDELHKLGLTYHDGIPYEVVNNLLLENGFDRPPVELITGATGVIHESIGKGYWLTFSWYRMQATGRFEVTAYIS